MRGYNSILAINPQSLDKELQPQAELNPFSPEETHTLLAEAGVVLSPEQAERIQVISTPRTNIVFVQNEYLEPGDPSFVDPQALISTGRVSAAVVEYFFPEFARNVDRSLPIIRHYAEKRMPGLENAPRFSYADGIADACVANGVDIAVAEIADGPEYILSDLTAPALTTLGILEFVTLEAVFKEVGLDAGKAIDIIQNLFVASFLTPYVQLLASTFVDKMMQRSDKSISDFPGLGMYNRQKMTLSEKLVFSMEKARRKHAADGILFLDQQYPVPDVDAEKPWITVFYPPAHAMRIMDHVLNKGFVRDRGQAIYKVLAPYLNWDLGIWRHKDMLEIDDGGEGHWNLISEFNLRS